MEEKKYYQNFDEFLEQHPEINPEWRSFMEPVIQGADDELFKFILSYIFM